MRASVGFVSLGCPKNLVDTENMISLLSNEGAVITADQSKADVVVINTCGFLEAAKQESLDTIGEFVQLKKKKKLKGVVVTGCMTERYLGAMKEKYPAVDAFLQTKEFSKITDVIRAIQNEDCDFLASRLLGETEQLEGHSEMTDFVQRSPGKRSFAYVKISEGCNRTCSFCIIPKLRGKHHSRSIEGVLDEIRQLVAQGTREIVFIAQDLTSYGRDIAGGQTSLLALLKEVEKIEGVHWYRLMYNYPRFFSDELIAFLAKSEKFSRYLDIPFQHFSDPILRAMRRPETSSEIRTLIQKSRASIPDLYLRTTLMVGFPGETESDLDTMFEFLDEAEFDHVGAFTFFQEKGTPSFDLPDQLPQEVKDDRYHRLMTHQRKIQKRRLKRHVENEVEIVIDGFSEKTRQGLIYRARHRGQAPEIDGITYVLSDNELEIGSFHTVQVAKTIGNYDLLGGLVPVRAEAQRKIS